MQYINRMYSTVQNLKVCDTFERPYFSLNFTAWKINAICVFHYHGASNLRIPLREAFSNNDYFILGSSKHKSHKSKLDCDSMSRKNKGCKLIVEWSY